MNQVVRHRERQVAADRAGPRVGRVRRAHRHSHRRDRALTLEHEREGRPRRDEVDELAEERLLGVLCVMLLRQPLVDVQQLRVLYLEPRASKRPRISPASPRPIASGLIRTSVCSAAIGGATLLATRCRRRRADALEWREAGSAPGSIGVSQYGHACQSGSSGGLQFVHACRSRVVHTGQTRKPARRRLGRPGSAAARRDRVSTRSP